MREAVNHFPRKLKMIEKKEWSRDINKATPDVKCATMQEVCNNAQTAWKVKTLFLS